MILDIHRCFRESVPRQTNSVKKQGNGHSQPEVSDTIDLGGHVRASLENPSVRLSQFLMQSEAPNLKPRDVPRIQS